MTSGSARDYVQEERYFAIEHMDVRREASQSRTAYQFTYPILKDWHHPAAATRGTSPCDTL